MIPMLLFVHLVGVVIWVGGMFFAYVCLRPAATKTLEQSLSLTLWKVVFDRFFPAVWAAVFLILLSGLGILSTVGFAGAPLHWHLMFLTGLIMMSVFVAIVLLPFRQLANAVATSNWSAGGAALGRIRQLVGFNLILGLATIAVATLGRWL